MIEKQMLVLEKHGIRVLDIKPRLKMVIVKRCDLERASELRVSGEITIASRRAI